jgi:hypothetical protein
MTQSTLRSGLTSTLYPHPRNLSPKKISAHVARYFPKLASITPLKASDTIALCSFIFARLLTANMWYTSP